MRTGTVRQGARNGLSWGHGNGKRAVAAFVVALSLLLTAPLTPTHAQASSAPVTPPHATGAVNGGSAEGTLRLIVESTPGAVDAVARAVKTLGGAIVRPLGIIDGLAIELPAAAVNTLAAHPGVRSVVPDGQVTLHAEQTVWSTGVVTYDSSPTVDSTMSVVTNVVTGANAWWARGFTGAGIDVALIDSGVVPVEGLTVPGKVLNGPDLSFESQVDELRYLDTFGHGTHMAGIIAGRDSGADPSHPGSGFMGMAPGARIVNVKVADAQGAVDVSQVIAAIDWVVQNAQQNGLNIRVLNLSFGTDGTQPYLLDPLAHAVEAAWRRNIVVVVAAGNDGNRSPLRNPAFDPYVIAVGAVDDQGTWSTADDVIPAFSNCGTAVRSVDLVAPGVSVVSLRNPNSFIDAAYPSAQVGDRFFKGTGTSQAAAVVSGAVALILDRHSDADPDKVKSVLMKSARPISTAPDRCQGAGVIDLEAALFTRPGRGEQRWDRATGLGSLEGARGSAHLSDDGVILAGEMDIFGAAWTPEVWAPLSKVGQAWDGGTWNGNSWSGNSWSGHSWSGNSWSAVLWSGNSWSGNSWSGNSWSGNSWSGNSWSGNSWSGNSWSGISWSGNSWSGTWAVGVWSSWVPASAGDWPSRWDARAGHVAYTRTAVIR